MNPHDDPRELSQIKNADNQKRRPHDPARRDEEHEQWHTWRAQPGVLEHNNNNNNNNNNHHNATTRAQCVFG